MDNPKPCSNALAFLSVPPSNKVLPCFPADHIVLGSGIRGPGCALRDVGFFLGWAGVALVGVPPDKNPCAGAPRRRRAPAGGDRRGRVDLCRAAGGARGGRRAADVGAAVAVGAPRSLRRSDAPPSAARDPVALCAALRLRICVCFAPYRWSGLWNIAFPGRAYFSKPEFVK